MQYWKRNLVIQQMLIKLLEILAEPKFSTLLIKILTLDKITSQFSPYVFMAWCLIKSRGTSGWCGA
jgi:hypothetical protein